MSRPEDSSPEELSRRWSESISGRDLDRVDLEATFRPERLSSRPGSRPRHLATFSLAEPTVGPPAIPAASGADDDRHETQALPPGPPVPQPERDDDGASRPPDAGDASSAGGDSTASRPTGPGEPADAFDADVTAAAAPIRLPGVPAPSGASDGEASANAAPLDAFIERTAKDTLRTLSAADETLELATTDRPTGALPPGSVAPGARVDPGTVFELVEEIGRGGMGVVYRARQRSLGRDVAIKKLKVPGEDVERKFLAEALVTGRLDHPNIVPVYDVGESATGEALLAMKLVDGVSWKRLLRPKTDAEKRRAEATDQEGHLRILLGVCNAIAFAHSRGIVHCDLKPENVMVGEFGEVLVMDWGLACDVRDDRPPAEAAEYLHKSELDAPFGTPAYMAPEQAWGHGHEVGPWTDVYLLGAILHEVVVGRPPHVGGGAMAVLWRAAHSEPHDYDASVPSDLAKICHVAMARKPEERFPSVTAFAEAVRDHLTHRESQTIAAQAQALLDRATAGADARARRDAASGRPLAEAERDAVYADLAEAVAGFRQAQVLWAGNAAAAGGERRARIAYAATAVQQGDLGLAEVQLAGLADAAAAAIRGRVEAARVEAERARQSAQLVRLGLIAAVCVIVTGLSFGMVLASNARDRALRLERTARDQGARADAARVEAERRLATSLVAEGEMLGAAARLVDARSRYRDALGIFERNGWPTLSAELGLFALERTSASALLVLAGDPGASDPVARAVAASPDGARVVAVLDDGTLRAWDALTGRILHVVPTGQDGPSGVAISDDGDRIATVAADGSVVIRDAGGAPVHTLEGHAAPVTAVAFAADRLVTGDRDGVTRGWDLETGNLLVDYEDPLEGPVAGLAVAPGEPYIFGVGADGAVRWWNRGGTSHSYVTPASGRSTSIAYSPWYAGRTFVLGGEDGSIRLYAWVQLWEKPEPPRKPGQPRDPRARGRLLKNGFHEVARERAHDGAVTSVAFSPDARHVVSTGLDGRVVAWRIELSRDDRGEVSAVTEPVLTAGDHRGAVLGVAVEPRGRWVATAGHDGTVRIYELALRRFDDATPEGVGRAVRPARIDPRLVGHAGERPDMETAPVRSVAVSPDGRLAAAGRADGRVELWESATGRWLGLLAEGVPVSRVRFIESGRALLVATDEGRVRIFDLVEGLASPGRWVDEEPLTPGAGRRVVAVGEGALAILTERGAQLDEVGDAAVAPRGDLDPLITDGDAAPTDAVLADDGATLLTAGPGRAVRVGALGALRGPTALELTHDAPVRCAAITADGARGATGDERGVVVIWNVEAGATARRIVAHAGAVNEVAFSEDGSLLYSAGADGRWRLVDVATGAEVRAFDGEHDGGVAALAVDAGGRTVVTGGEDGTVFIWDLGRAGRERLLAETPREASRALRGDPDDAKALAALGRWFAFRGGWTRAVAVLEAARRAGAEVDPLLLARAHWSLDHHVEALEELERASPSDAPEAYLAICRRRLAALAIEAGTILGREPQRVADVAYSPDGAWIVTGDHEARVTVWDGATGLARWSHRVPGVVRVSTVAVSRDGRFVAAGGSSAGSGSGGVTVWEAATGRQVARLGVDDGEPSLALAFAAGGRLLEQHGTKELRAWRLDAPDAPPQSVITGPLRRFVMSDDGETLAVARRDPDRVEVHALAGGGAPRELAVTEKAGSMAFAGSTRLVVHEGDLLRVFDVATGGLVNEVPYEDGSVFHLDASSDGSFAVVVGMEHTARRVGEIRVVSLESGETRRTWWQIGIPLAVAIRPDGNRFVVGSGPPFSSRDSAGLTVVRAVPGR